MKDKIIFLIVGLLLGAIISTGSIYFYTLAESSNSSEQQNSQMPGTLSDGMGGNMNGGTPPEMPNNNTQQN